MSSAGNPVSAVCTGALLSNGLTTYGCNDLQSGVYLAPSDVILFALPARVVADFGVDVLWAACAAASSEFRGYARKRYRMPLIGWGVGVVSKLAYRAAYAAMRQRGFNVEGNPGVVSGYAEAGQWMEDVRDYKIDPDIIESQPMVNTPRMVSNPLRGW